MKHSNKSITQIFSELHMLLVLLDHPLYLVATYSDKLSGSCKTVDFKLFDAIQSENETNKEPLSIISIKRDGKILGYNKTTKILKNIQAHGIVIDN